MPRLPRWLARHTAAVIAVDVASVVAATAGYGLLGTASIGVLVTGGAVVLALTAAALLLARAWTPAVLGQGTDEFARLLNGIAGAAVVIGLASLALDYPQGRPLGVRGAAGRDPARPRRP